MKVSQRTSIKYIRHLLFKISKQNINKPELNSVQGQQIHTLLHLYSALSLIDNLPVLSEGRIFTTSTACSENRYALAACTDHTNKTCIAESTGSCAQPVHNSPECRLYLWSIRIKRRYTVLNVRREQDIVRPPAPVQITPELLTATVFYLGIESHSARNLVRSCGKATGMQTFKMQRIQHVYKC